VDRLLAEIQGIRVAFACLIAITISEHAIDDIEWKEANEEDAAASARKMKP
jgi:hypothetical protein